MWRDKAANSQIGSNFGSVPYNNVADGKISEDRFSIQNCRLGFRVDGDWKGAHFIGYNEFDFLGQRRRDQLSASPTAPWFPASASTGWMSEEMAGNFWRAKAGAC